MRRGRVATMSEIRLGGDDWMAPALHPDWWKGRFYKDPTEVGRPSAFNPPRLGRGKQQQKGLILLDRVPPQTQPPSQH